MYGRESKEDGEIRFHYRREDRTGDSPEPGQEKGPLLKRLFRMNRSSLIVLLDIILLTVVFIIFQPRMTRTDYRLQTDLFRVELSGFLFDEKGYVSCSVEALEDNPGGEVRVRVFTGTGKAEIQGSDTLPQEAEGVTSMRFEIPLVEADEKKVYAEVLLPGMDEGEVLEAVLRE